MDFEKLKESLSNKLIKAFIDFCMVNYNDNRSEDTFKDYAFHLNNTNNYLDEIIDYAKNNSFNSLFIALNTAVKTIKFDKKDYLFLIGWYLYNGDKLYAMTIFDLMYKLLKTTENEFSGKNIANSNDILDNISNSLAAFNYLQDFLLFYDVKKDNTIDLNNYQSVAEDFANKIRNKINKGDLHKLDGMDPLIAELKVDGFIRLAIESSYFFSPELVMDQKIDLEKRNYARHTKDQKIKNNSDKKGNDSTYEIDGKNYHVYIDKDNNTAVRSLINEKTGITISSGKGSILQNTVISHVWGRAYDPRYFTSLWNIVLIPAWANSLMDKEDATPGSLASKIRATYMAVCSELYFTKLDSQYWQNMRMKDAPDIPNKYDIIPGNYTLYILNEKDKKAIQIKLQTVEIKKKIDS